MKRLDSPRSLNAAVRLILITHPALLTLLVSGCASFTPRLAT